MITPLDIRNMKFSSNMLGYKKVEVDAFLDEILLDYEKLYRKSSESDEKIKSLSKLVKNYEEMEETMKNTLVVAQSSAEQLTTSSRAKADSIIAEAELKSKEIISKATEKLVALQTQYDELKKEISLSILHSKAELEIQLKSLEDSLNKFNTNNI